MTNRILCARLRRASVVCGAAAALLGLTALFGWITGNELLKGSVVAGITMKTNAAFCVTLMGALSVSLGVRTSDERLLPRASATLALLVVAISSATLVQHLFGVDLGIDELLFQEPAGAVATQSPNRMGLVASSCLTLLGLSQLLVDVRRGERAPSQFLAIAVMLVTSVPLLGYLFDAHALYSIARWTGIALPTAAALWLIAVGHLLARPELGLMRRLVEEDSGALLLRRLLPAAIAMPVLLMLVRLWGQDLGLYDQVVGRALLVIAYIVVFTGVVWRTGDVVLRQATRAARAERALHERLLQSLDALADTDRRKTDFLAVLAHELRNPLAPVRSAVHLLRARSGPDPESARTFALMERQIAHLARLIDDLMDVSRISQDKLELRKSEVRLSDVVSGALEASRFLLDAQSHRVAILLPSEEVHLEADAARLVQVFTNLLTNAARYTPPGGEITLEAQLESDALLIEVRDNGMGIAPEQLPRVFEMFYQAGQAGRSGVQGLGIGLALVRKLVELHGGSVSASSAGSGAGSAFSVRLPLSLAVRAPAVSAGKPAPALPALGSLRVLVVEDNADSAEMLSELLSLTGAEVRASPDGETGLQMAAEFRPQVIVLDIGLPGMSGYDVARQIRASSWGDQAFIVALTGWGSEEDRVRSRQAGIQRHLVKPVNPEALLGLISEIRGKPAGKAEADIESAAGRSGPIPV